MRVRNTPAFILLNRPYRETSWILEIFSREYGRLALLAKGARAKKSRYRGLLQPFQPLLLSWSGRGEVPTLIGAESTGGFNELAGRSMICGFYLNELVYRLLTRHDPHAALFDQYTVAMDALQGADGLDRTLRIFEISILRETGYALRLDCDFETGEQIEPEAAYRYITGRGALKVDSGKRDQDHVFSGRSLIAIREDHVLDESTLTEAKQLLRTQLSHQLGRHTIVSRSLYPGSLRTQAA